MLFSNFIHLNSMPLKDDELQQVLNLNLNYFNPNGEYWNWTDNDSSMDVNLINENVSFITNISFCTKQLEEIQILFVEKYNGDNNFTVVKRFFEIPANEVLSFQNVMILGIHHNSINNPSQGFHNINIDMTISNAAIENAKAKRGKTPIWETLFGIVLPFIPDINSLDPFIPVPPDIPDYDGIDGGVIDIVHNDVPGFIPTDNLYEITPQELDGIYGSYRILDEDIIIINDEYPAGITQGTSSEWDTYNYPSNGGV